MALLATGDLEGGGFQIRLSTFNVQVCAVTKRMMGQTAEIQHVYMASSSVEEESYRLNWDPEDLVPGVDLSSIVYKLNSPVKDKDTEGENERSSKEAFLLMM